MEPMCIRHNEILLGKCEHQSVEIGDGVAKRASQFNEPELFFGPPNSYIRAYLQ